MMPAIRGSSSKFTFDEASSTVRKRVSCSGGRAASVPVKQTPDECGRLNGRRQWAKILGGQKLIAQIDTDHFAIPIFTHNVGQKIVQQSTVDQDPLANLQRRNEAGDRDGGPHGQRQRPPPMNDLFAGDHGGGDREKPLRQMLNQDVAEKPTTRRLTRPPRVSATAGSV
jgi:hypothetical protein